MVEQTREESFRRIDEIVLPGIQRLKRIEAAAEAALAAWDADFTDAGDRATEQALLAAFKALAEALDE